MNSRELRSHEAEPFSGVVVHIATFEHLNQRADRGQRVADFMGDTGGEQPKRGHLLLMQHLSLRLLEFARPLGDALFQLRVQPGKLVADAAQEASQGDRGPSDPAENDEAQHQRDGLSLLGRQREEEQAVADAVQPASNARHDRRMAQCGADQRQNVVVAEGAIEPAVREAEQPDEEGFQARDDERVGAEHDAATPRVEGVERGEGEAEREDGVKRKCFGGRAEVRVEVADDEAEPADLDRHRLGIQIPARGLRRDLRHVEPRWQCEVILCGLGGILKIGRTHLTPVLDRLVCCQQQFPIRSPSRYRKDHRHVAHRNRSPHHP